MADRVLTNMTGRVYRVAPPGFKSTVPKLDLKSSVGCVAALQSPNQATRYLAWTELHKMQGKAQGELEKLWNQQSDPRMRARALQLLARIKGGERTYVKTALKDKDSDIRITGLRIARELKMDVIPYVKQLANDTSAQVRRECAIALRHSESADAPKVWAKLAAQHDGKDRWYLEALGIGADKQEEGLATVEAGGRIGPAERSDQARHVKVAGAVRDQLGHLVLPQAADGFAPEQLTLRRELRQVNIPRVAVGGAIVVHGGPDEEVAAAVGGRLGDEIESARAIALKPALDIIRRVRKADRRHLIGRGPGRRQCGVECRRQIRFEEQPLQNVRCGAVVREPGAQRRDQRVVRPVAEGIAPHVHQLRSEERRVGKECRSRWSPY